MEKYTDILRKLADKLDDDWAANVVSVCRELLTLVVDMLLSRGRYR